MRQSTPDQLANNPESRRRQYALADRARALGWENVIVIDDDLGRSGGGTARPRFERLLAAICTGSAGAVLAIEASRLARNGRDWHTLLEFSTLVSSLIIDEDDVYDPKLINDRLLLGMKGTFSELELSILRQRSQEALRLKAARRGAPEPAFIVGLRGPGVPSLCFRKPGAEMGFSPGCGITRARRNEKKDWRYRQCWDGETVDGVLYPRASGLFPRARASLNATSIRKN